ncbi:MAG: molybdopterin molybdotransferase MoeA [Hungatella sp.]|nr:molybdopterin molybdotransferase MoeA [Hungatella sp.]
MERIGLEEAVKRLIGVSEPIEETQLLALEKGMGRVLAREYKAALPQPPFNRSPLDGYALRAEDTAGASKDRPAVLEVIDKIMAGMVSKKMVIPGTAVRLMTGAPVPDGTDCVVGQEDTDYGEKCVRVYRELKVHENMVDAGEDYQAGTVLMEKGERIDAAAAGILAGAGIGEVKVYRRLRVALFTTGDEVIEPGKGREAGKIYDSNRYLMWGRLKELGIEPVCWEHIGDEAKTAAERIAALISEVDMVLTTGGVSVGEKDIMHDVVSILNGDRLFWRVALKPGSPALAFCFQGKPVICLSGNPFGAFVTLEMIVRPVLAYMMREPLLAPERRQARVNGGFHKRSSVRRFIRGIYKDGCVVLPERGHASGVLFSMKRCNCLVDIPAGSEGLADGDEVAVWLLE